jgi:hypothetical protein
LDVVPVAVSAAASQANALPAMTVKPSSTDVKSTTASTRRSSNAGGNFDSAPQGSHLMDSGPGVDASAMGRDLSGARAAVSTTSGPAAAATGPDSRETFATLDAGKAPGQPAWIHSGMQRAEAGFQDPALGWIGVRADSSGGGVHAELVPSSADAAQALGTHIAGLNAYLSEHHTPVDTLTLSAPESWGTGMGGNSGTGDGMQQGAGQQAGEQTAMGAEIGPSSGLNDAVSLPGNVLPASFEGLDASAQAGTQRGTHISVMA